MINSAFKKFVSLTAQVFSNLLILLIVGLRPLLGSGHCKFSVSCTEFATLKLKEGPFLHALWEIIKRLVRCQPFYNPK